MNIAICDDHKDELLKISRLVEEFIESSPSDHCITYAAFENGADLIAAIEGGSCFDLLLLDIVMPLIDGIELAQEIRTKDTCVKIVFLTSSAEFAVDSYGVNAFYYLLKPIKKEGLLPLLKKAHDDLFDETENQFLVKHGAALSVIHLHQLRYAEIIGRTVVYHLKSGETLQSIATMLQVEAKLLTDKRFIKPHRSYIVNMDCIKAFSPEGITTAGDESIPISRNLYKQTKQAYIDYLLANKRVL